MALISPRPSLINSAHEKAREFLVVGPQFHRRDVGRTQSPPLSPPPPLLSSSTLPKSRRYLSDAESDRSSLLSPLATRSHRDRLMRRGISNVDFISGVVA